MSETSARDVAALTAGEREAHGRRAGTFPQAQLVYSLTDVEAIIAERIAVAWRAGYDEPDANPYREKP